MIFFIPRSAGAAIKLIGARGNAAQGESQDLFTLTTTLLYRRIGSLR